MAPKKNKSKSVNESTQPSDTSNNKPKAKQSKDTTEKKERMERKHLM